MRIIKRTAELIGRIAALFCPKSAPTLYRATIAHIYTGFLKRNFYAFGQDSVIAYRATNLQGLEQIAIGNSTQISKGIQLTAWATPEDKPHRVKIKIGNNCNIRNDAHITAINSVVIGDNLLTGTNVLITDNSHGTTDAMDLQLPPDERRIISKGPVRIGRNVWIGNNACIMPGVSIGDGAVIGANSIVTKDIPPYCVAAGIPARIISNKQKELI